MAILRRRYFFWLLKAYIKRWGKQFVFFFIVGLIAFSLLIRFYPLLLQLIPFEKKTVIGLSGTYTTDNLPQVLVNKIARGLTKVESDGTISPDLASSWKISKDGKKYTFFLKKGLRFSDGEPFTSSRITYSFAKVSIERPDDHTITFTLTEPYTPFLVTVSRPIFSKNLIGVGKYRIHKIDVNGEFLENVRLISVENKFDSETYIFYPTTEALKIALALGEVTKVNGITKLTLDKIDFKRFHNISVKRQVNHRTLVTLFYNTQDPLLSDKKIRNGLTYALPDDFKEGLRAYNPYSPQSKYYNSDTAERKQDINHATLLLSTALESASVSAKPKVQITTLEKYKETAEYIAKLWKELGIETTIESTVAIPDQFQIFLGDFNIPKDPDQYTLWHSGQNNNITKLRNLRIDKLIEDGRKTLDGDERIKIYSDFQKYLIDEAPAAFLYFPYEYELTRK